MGVVLKQMPRLRDLSVLYVGLLHVQINMLISLQILLIIDCSYILPLVESQTLMEKSLTAVISQRSSRLHVTIVTFSF